MKKGLLFLILFSGFALSQEATEILDDLTLIKPNIWANKMREGLVSKIGNPNDYELIIVRPVNAASWVLGLKIRPDEGKVASAPKYEICFFQKGAGKVVRRDISKKDFLVLTEEATNLLLRSTRKVAFDQNAFSPATYYVFCKNPVGQTKDNAPFMSGRIIGAKKKSRSWQFTQTIELHVARNE